MIWPEVRKAYPDQWPVVEALEAHTEGHQRLLDRSGLFCLSPRPAQHTQDRQHKKGQRHDKDQVVVAATPFHDVAVDRRPGHGCQPRGDVVQPGVGPQVGVGGRGVHLSIFARNWATDFRPRWSTRRGGATAIPQNKTDDGYGLLDLV
jgi:hypothetical protein